MNYQRLLLIISTILLGVLIYNPLNGQSVPPSKEIVRQDLIWFAYFNNLELSKKYYLVSEVQERRFTNPSRQHQLLFRSHLHYRFTKDWDVSAGFTYFLQWPNDPLSKSDLVVPELRPHIQMDGKSKLGDRWNLVHRYRLENRFFRNVEDGELASGYWSYYRFRYRLGVSCRLSKPENRKVHLKLSDEIMFNFGEKIVLNSFDQNRFYAGVSVELNKSFTIEGGYMNWFQQRPVGYSYYNRDIIRLILVHSISLNKDRNES